MSYVCVLKREKSLTFYLIFIKKKSHDHLNIGFPGSYINVLDISLQVCKGLFIYLSVLLVR